MFVEKKKQELGLDGSMQKEKCIIFVKVVLGKKMREISFRATKRSPEIIRLRFKSKEEEIELERKIEEIMKKMAKIFIEIYMLGYEQGRKK
jgi:hypothetical protein